MKITETWDNRVAVIAACREKHACNSELAALVAAKTETAWYAVLYRNFGWCVRRIGIEEWLPSELPACESLYCSGCTGLNWSKLPV